MLKKVMILCWLSLIMLWDVVTSPIVAFMQHLDHLIKLGPERTLDLIKEEMTLESIKYESISKENKLTFEDDPEEFIRKIPYESFGHFKNFSQDPVNGGATVVKLCADYASYVRLQEAVARINKSPELKNKKINLILAGKPEEVSEEEEPYDGPYWCDIECGSVARLEQLIHEVELAEMMIGQISYLNALELELSPDAPLELKNSAHPWPWHPYETVRPNEVPISEVPYWKE